MTYHNSKGDVCNINVNVHFYEGKVSGESSPRIRKINSTPDVTMKRPRISQQELHESTVDGGLDVELGTSQRENGSADIQAMRLYNEHKGKDDYYQMTWYPKGRVLIINNYFRGKKARKGSLNDVQKLQELFQYIGRCSVTLAQDLSAEQIVATVKSFAKSSTAQGFCAVFIMSHGRSNSTGRLDVLVGNDNSTVNVNDLVASFKSEFIPHLRNTPVMLFFQMCRGPLADRRRDHYVPVEQHIISTSSQNDAADDDEDDQRIRNLLSSVLPRGKYIGLLDVDDEDVEDAISAEDDADETGPEHIGDEPNMLISFSTMERYKSFRRSTGSWFIQAICDVFREHAQNENIIELMNRVHSKVSDRTVNSSRLEIDGCRVCSRTTHSFGEKRLYLFPGLP